MRLMKRVREKFPRKEKYYSIAIREKKEDGDFFLADTDYKFKVVGKKWLRQSWFADPFLFEFNGTIYLFFEIFDLIIRKGSIGVSVIENGEMSSPKVIISEKYHMSFPFVFMNDNDIYIMPETNEDGNIHLYKAIDFPYKWEKSEILVGDFVACDSILFEYEDKVHLLTSEILNKPPQGKLQSCWVRNILFSKAHTGAYGNRGQVVAEGDYGIRNAGKCFYYKNKCIRPGQNCTESIYGRGICFFEIRNIKPYEERLIGSIDGSELIHHLRNWNRKSLIGAHTYNSSEHYEVIDISYVMRIPLLTWLKRVYHVFRCHIIT